MAAARLWATACLLHATFILLSGASPETRCYWCGPLAEQVHRSRRSAPCGASAPVTVCEPGYNYCAVVATSPLRVESRYCVKVYQDECYPLYCNSTKTWKMTCPCRGDLCNGPNTEREIEAFALLPKLVEKTHNARIKKRTANATPYSIKHNKKNKIINTDDAESHNITNNSNDMNANDNKLIVTESDATSNIGDNVNQPPENMQSDQPTNIVIEQHNEEDGSQSTVANNVHTSTAVTNQLIVIEIHVSDPTEKTDTIQGNEQACTESLTTTQSNDVDKNTEPLKSEEATATATATATVPSVSSTETSMKPTGNINTAESETIKTKEIVHHTTTETKLTDKPPAESSVTTTEMMSNDQPMNPIDQMQNDAPFVNPTETPLKLTEVMKMDEPPTKETVKISSGAPTAEALQQNGSPVTAAPIAVTPKATEPTTTEATTSPTVSTTNEQTTMKSTIAPKRKNNATRNALSFALIFLIGLVYL